MRRIDKEDAKYFAKDHLANERNIGKEFRIVLDNGSGFEKEN